MSRWWALQFLCLLIGVHFAVDNVDTSVFAVAQLVSVLETNHYALRPTITTEGLLLIPFRWATCRDRISGRNVDGPYYVYTAVVGITVEHCIASMAEEHIYWHQHLRPEKGTMRYRSNSMNTSSQGVHGQLLLRFCVGVSTLNEQRWKPWLCYESMY